MPRLHISLIRQPQPSRERCAVFATAFDTVVDEIRLHYPKGIPGACSDNGRTLAPFGFERIQGSVYLTRNSDMANLLAGVLALKSLPWFPRCVRHVRGFRVENWSDFTALVRDPA